MNTVLRNIGLFSLLTVMPCAVVGQTQLRDSKKEAIEQLLDLSIPVVLIQPVSDLAVKDITESLKKVAPELPSEAIAIARDETVNVVKEHAKDLKERMYLLYDRLFSQDEIGELLRFYQTSIGQKLIQLAPTLGAEGLQSGQQMAKTLYPTITERVLARLRKEGFWKD